MNCHESFFIAIRQGTYAKDAKAPSLADNPDLLHTNYPVSQKGDPATVLEVREHKRRLNGPVREYQGGKREEGETA